MIGARHQTCLVFRPLSMVTLPLLLLWGLLGAPAVPSVRGQDPPNAGVGSGADAQLTPLPPALERQMDLIRARILSRQGLVPQSLDLYRDLRTRFPGHREIWIDFIETLVNEGLYEASEEELAAFLDRYPGDSRALRIRGRVFFEQGRFAAAYPVYDRLLTAFPEDAGIWSDYGYARQEGGDWAGALNCFSRVLELDPENEDALRSVHWILRDHLPRVDAGYRLYRQEEGDAAWATWYLRYARHLTEKSWWTFSYERVVMDRPAQPFLPAVDETLHDASLQVDYRFNRLVTVRAGAGLFSGLGEGTGLTLGLEARPAPGLTLRADGAFGRPWYDPLEAVAEEGREHHMTLSGEWTGWPPWTLSVEAEQSDFEVRDLTEYGRRKGIFGMVARRFGDNPFLSVSYTYATRRFEYESETFRPVALIEREDVHGISAFFEHRACTYWTYSLSGGVRRDTARDLDSWFVHPEIRVRMGNRVEGRVSFEHASEAGTVAGGTSRTLEAELRILF